MSKKVLYNKVSNDELRKAMEESTEKRTTVSFYKYFHIENPQAFRDDMYVKFNELGVLGRIYIAEEGINAQMNVPTKNFEAFKETLYNMTPELDGLRLNIAIDDNDKSFWVLRMKVKKKIVADGIDDPTFSLDEVGEYLKADQVNKMIDDPNTLFVDMRNHYEYEVGHFENAVEIPSDTFKEQLPMAVEMLEEYKGRDDKNIVMYCTGGIRCEKASAYMKHEGFKNVYHVEGGIIEYARKAKEQDLPIKFKGKNFVFDERMGERITDDVISHCHQCGKSSDRHTNCANEVCNLLFIQCEECQEKYHNCCSEKCIAEHALPEEEKIALRKGQENSNKIFSKGRHESLMMG